MKVSLNTIAYYNDLYHSAPNPVGSTIDDLTGRIGRQLGAIEDTIQFGARFEGALIVKVVSVTDHPNADKLHVCMVDDGGAVKDIERDADGLVQVVCGAPNVHGGMLAVWLPPGSTVPESRDKDPFVLGARELRGTVSNGMLASPRELTLGDSHDGILDITADADTIKPGQAFVEAYNLQGDVVIDIENKMFTHRPDCFGLLGVARELAGIQQQAYRSPDWYTEHPEFPQPETDVLALEVDNQLPALVPRFTAIAMDNISVGPSPTWLQLELAKAGIRSINNIVDYTNYFMLLTGQPLHAYDYDKLVAQDKDATTAKIVVRHPHKGETIFLLNGKEIEPRTEAIMIATRDTLIGVGGVMGGGDTEVGETTKRIVLEAANFDMYSIRRTSMAHGLFTDAVTRFNKGQSPLQNLAVLAKIVDEIRQFAGGKVASAVMDIDNANHDPLVVQVSQSFINDRLGLTLSPIEMKTLLENVEFKVGEVEGNLTVTVPFWRTDIAIPEDIVEEVGRLYGFDKLPLNLPRRGIVPAQRNELLDLKQRIRTTLAKTGGNEVLTYSFVHGNLLEKVGQDAAQAFQIGNALSPDLQYYRLSLTPSLLDKVHMNIKAGYDEFALFELGRAHHTDMVDEEGLPRELERIAYVYTADAKKAKQAREGAAYYQAKHVLDYLLATVGTKNAVSFKPMTEVDTAQYKAIEQMCKPYEPARSAVLWNGEMVVGVIGEFRTSVRKALKLPDYCAGFETFHRFYATKQQPTYVPLPRFPKIEQDICLRVSGDTTYQQVFDLAWEFIETNKAPETLATLSPVDIYQRDDDIQHKQITLRLTIASYEKTLRDSEVAQLLDNLAATASQSLKAERV